MIGRSNGDAGRAGSSSAAIETGIVRWRIERFLPLWNDAPLGCHGRGLVPSFFPGPGVTDADHP
jgi:hypothetical protein